MNTHRARRVLVIGLDCAAPEFIFGDAAFPLPHLHSLMAQGLWGRMRSCDPPITVPAWSVMTSGVTPGELGIYGFRNRADHGYGTMTMATGEQIRVPRLWDIASRHGNESIVIGVPQTYPPKPLRGHLIADFLTPDTATDYTYPKRLKTELESAVGEYVLDVRDYRTDEKDSLLKQLHRLMQNRFDVAEYMAAEKPWDFFMMVEIGLDRLHHGFWRHCDPSHPKHDANSPFRNAFRDYYVALDERIGRLLALADDDTTVLVVSDHGARAMLGGFCMNEWLRREGYLILKQDLTEPTPFSTELVDWSRTTAWSEGGYYARVFINRAGREPQGIVQDDAYESLRDELRARLTGLRNAQGEPMRNQAHRPEDLYPRVNGIAPDLLVYFGNLAYRSIGTLGVSSLYTDENDTGPDDANHDFDGVCIVRAPGVAPRGEQHAISILDIAPTVLATMGINSANPLCGRILTQ